MHSFNRNYNPTNPFGYQENPNPSPPQNRQPTNPTQIPLTRGHPHGLVYSPFSGVAGFASYLGNWVFTNFPYDDSSIPDNLSQPDSIPETQPQDVGGSSSKPAKKSHKKKRMKRKH
ncbi:hypothetical protein Hanom_Chr08g00724711 [Helianthus anomalus]